MASRLPFRRNARPVAPFVSALPPPHPAGEKRADELVEADFVGLRRLYELAVETRGHADQHSAAEASLYVLSFVLGSQSDYTYSLFAC